MNSKDFKKIILDKLTSILKPNHFKKTGNTFVYSNNDLTYFINVQSSQSSSVNILKITVNVEIASVILYGLEDTSIPEKHRKHFHKRIGFYLDQPHDKWWTIGDMNTASIAAIEINEVINTRVLPEFNILETTNDLANLWRQNQCPGLTNLQRNHYLSILEQQKSVE